MKGLKPLIGIVTGSVWGGMRHPAHLRGAASLFLLAAAACSSAPAGPEAPPGPATPPATSSAVIVALGDVRVMDAVRRVVLGPGSRVVEALLEEGAFNDALTDEEAASFLALARAIPVAPGADARDPARGARRLVYAMLAARVVATGSWSDADEWFDATPDQDHRNDIAAAFAVTDWWPLGRVAAPRTGAEREAWRATLGRILARTTDQMAKRRLVRNARGKLALLPRSPAEPEGDRRAAAAFLARRIEIETDDGTRDELRAALSATGFAAPSAAEEVRPD